jgi:hypothetical protein
MSALLQTLSVPLPQLQSMKLVKIPFTTPQLHTLITHTPRLDTVVHSNCAQVDSLTFLEPLRATLCSLFIECYAEEDSDGAVLQPEALAFWTST